MVEVRNPEQDLYRLRLRLGVALAFVVLCFSLLAARLAFLQIYRFEQFHAQAEDNRISLVPVPPSRGLIYDRNGLLLADNVSAYTLELVPSELEQSIDRTIDLLNEIVEIPPRDRRRFKRLLEDSRNYDSVPLKTRLTDEEVAKLAAMRFQYRGVEVRARQFREYPLGETGAHVLGYIGRISPADKQRLDDAGLSTNYAGSTHIGKTGVELSYESRLHGQAGTEEVEVSAGGRTVRSLSRTPAVPGANLILSVDIRLQKLIEDWYGNRRGALVAIEPKTGDVLAMVSKPTFDPNLFIDGIDSQTWKDLNEDPNKPLLNRPLRGTYPPGSTYKPFMAMLVLSSGLRAPGYAIRDPGFFMLGNHRYRDSVPGGHGSVDLRKSIEKSSDTYYYSAAYELGVDKIHDFMQPWGFGQLTGIDLEHESTGILPSSTWKMRRYKQKWLPGETPSIGIGQGYNSFTMLQLAHALTILINDGTVMKPHVVREIEDPVTREREKTVRTPSAQLDYRREYFELVKNAMHDVMVSGTGRSAFVGAEYKAAGKTGTAQVIGIKQNERYDARRIAERFRDHSLFIAFAPMEDPKIALALIVENGGFGAASAAPIARKVFDYYLLGKLPKETDMPFPQPEDNQADDPEMRDIPDDLEPETVSGDTPAAVPAASPVPPSPAAKPAAVPAPSSPAAKPAASSAPPSPAAKPAAVPAPPSPAAKPAASSGPSSPVTKPAASPAPSSPATKPAPSSPAAKPAASPPSPSPPAKPAAVPAPPTSPTRPSAVPSPAKPAAPSSQAKPTTPASQAKPAVPSSQAKPAAPSPQVKPAAPATPVKPVPPSPPRSPSSAAPAPPASPPRRVVSPPGANFE
ncbi:MAG: penicillin-binding protein 2 [Burkholderiaceae bacterium]